MVYTSSYLFVGHRGGALQTLILLQIETTAERERERERERDHTNPPAGLPCSIVLSGRSADLQREAGSTHTHQREAEKKQLLS